MKSFPMFLCTTNRRVIIVGGGEAAAQKTRLILKSDAQVVVASSSPNAEITELIRAGRIAQHSDTVTPDLFDAALMAFICTGCEMKDAWVRDLAHSVRCPVNVVDRPELCDLLTPSIVDRDPVVVAIGTEGTAPVLARKIKTEIETLLPTNLGRLAFLAGRLRPMVTEHISPDQRRRFWQWVFSGSPYRDWVQGNESKAQRNILTALSQGQLTTNAGRQSVSVIQINPDETDLISLRSIRLLQDADVIIHDRRIATEILELARRDARRVMTDERMSGTRREKFLKQLHVKETPSPSIVVLEVGEDGVSSSSPALSNVG